MRFKKGSKVEVMNNEVPASWRVAEIISSNGHAYNVRYYDSQGVEKVSRRFIRPSPPAIGSWSWLTGDIVEVFDENSWKIATVLKVLKGGRFLIRPHGFTHEMKVHKMNIRARQSWYDGQWIPVGKICQEKDDYLTRLQKPKRVSPFSSSLRGTKKVKPADKDESQRHVSGHSFTKSENRRHTSLASKDQKQDSVGKIIGTFQHPFATDKTSVCCQLALI